ncbi:hypothetical protein TBLA_0C01870 [Henningerozyma blattae CBS 6284]|uniref:Diacylglycerol O-acyltransferase n=1 Tax=Henningerozyma blattae (strain ATCC 34711 / CBS 6284 / DSM 70876 / NBRC 10599 / NRRL Y-10934 / UCD 77-7) TaxID=1071380 RepID=I2H0U8_HENB6|nr:hypothetical protein TBLA_0C01870 [Tetrapisispora blattae CBS 6284]CCH60000.1 hypothetical protein TBLA_0C01870 [Tetrapisispora blattae CBS 6284]
MASPTLSSNCTPLNTPWKQRLEGLAVMWHVTTIGLFTMLSIYLLLHPRFYFFIIPYGLYYFNDRTPANGNVVKRYSMKMRSLPIWNYYCNYFPLSLKKTTDLQPTFTEIQDPVTKTTIQSKTGPTYLFGYHPHGVGSLGAFGAFATEGCQYSEKFPGIPMSLMTLVNQFVIPFHRDYLLSLGITSVSKKNVLKTLRNNQSICIVIGGARESLVPFNEKTADIILDRRRGFIKLAIQTGNVALVPVFAFGETKAYKLVDTKTKPIIHKLQLWFKSTFGFTIPLFYARGFFNYDFGLLPFRTPIAVVVGQPVLVKEKYEVPPEELINKYHEIYETQLKKLYYENRKQYGFGDIELRIIG